MFKWATESTLDDYITFHNSTRKQVLLIYSPFTKYFSFFQNSRLTAQRWVLTVSTVPLAASLS